MSLSSVGESPGLISPRPQQGKRGFESRRDDTNDYLLMFSFCDRIFSYAKSFSYSGRATSPPSFLGGIAQQAERLAVKNYCKQHAKCGLGSNPKFFLTKMSQVRALLPPFPSSSEEVVMELQLNGRAIGCVKIA